MKLASVIHHNPSPAHIKFDSVKLTPPFPIHMSTKLQFPHSHPFYFSANYRHFPPIACLRATDQEDSLSSPEQKDKNCISENTRLDNVEDSCDVPSSFDDSDEKMERQKHFASSVKTVAFWVCAAVAFGVGIGFRDGVAKASEFFTGNKNVNTAYKKEETERPEREGDIIIPTKYLLEQSLSVDNLFVFVLIFKYFKVPIMYQSRVLSFGIVVAVIFRLSLIILGTATIERFEAVNLLLAAILLFSAFKLFSEEEDDGDLSENFIVKTCQKFIPVTSRYDGDRFITVQDGVWKATPLLLTVAVIELSDIAFAVDSIPAVFGVTRDPFIVFSSNLFAILGLRSLYTLISESMSDLEYLQPAIATVLGFIGSKMILDFFGFHVSTEVSLGFVVTTLGGGVLLSQMKKSK